ncbi:MAG: hypothetical protein ACI9VI_002672, partial [Candidatus Azotimanducaceae bacterium]
GVGKTAEEVIRKAKSELGSLLPWVDLTNTAWATLNIDRAEPSQRLKTRPEFPFVEAKDNALVCWPTKLTLCPMLGQDVLQIIENKNLPKSRKEKEALPNLPLAPVAQTPWEIAFG